MFSSGLCDEFKIPIPRDLPWSVSTHVDWGNKVFVGVELKVTERDRIELFWLGNSSGGFLRIFSHSASL